LLLHRQFAVSAASQDPLQNSAETAAKKVNAPLCIYKHIVPRDYFRICYSLKFPEIYKQETEYFRFLFACAAKRKMLILKKGNRKVPVPLNLGGFILLEVTLQQTLQGNAVAGLVEGRLMDGFSVIILWKHQIVLTISGAYGIL